MSETKRITIPENTRVIIDTENRIVLFEPVEEIVKKPLYTNAYKTEFFEGDEVHYILSRHNCKPRIAFGYTSDPMEAEGYYSEAMTERECHRYIDEHWDELHK
jgi:hypothetical protein